MDPNAPPSAIGESEKKDLRNQKNAVLIQVPFALVDSFYKTTNLQSPTDCSTLNTGRFGATATYLPDSARVLIVGGANIMDDGTGPTLSYPREIEMYNPTTGGFDHVADFHSGGARAYHTATLLSDGRVLIAGGEALVQSAPAALKSALIIDPRDPSNVTVSDTGIVMQQERSHHVAALLADGRVVLAGGVVTGQMTQPFLSSIEVFDPSTGMFGLAMDQSGLPVALSAARSGHSGVLLKSGYDLMVSGGMNSDGPVLGIDVVRMGQSGGPASLVKSTDMIGVGAVYHAAGMAEDGTVLLSGGYTTVADASPSSGLPLHSSPNVEIWQFDGDAMTISKVCSANMSTGRGFHTLSMIGRRVLFVGGRGPDGLPLASGEIAELLGAGANCFATQSKVNAMTDARTEHSSATLETGEILVVGGKQQGASDPFGHSITSSEIYSPARDL
jgi:hypothetical protein